MVGERWLAGARGADRCTRSRVHEPGPRERSGRRRSLHYGGSRPATRARAPAGHYRPGTAPAQRPDAASANLPFADELSALVLKSLATRVRSKDTDIARCLAVPRDSLRRRGRARGLRERGPGGERRGGAGAFRQPPRSSDDSTRCRAPSFRPGCRRALHPHTSPDRTRDRTQLMTCARHRSDPVSDQGRSVPLLAGAARVPRPLQDRRELALVVLQVLSST